MIFYCSEVPHSPTEGHFTCSQVLASINKADFEHPCSGLGVDLSFQLFFWVNTNKCDCWIICMVRMFSFVRHCQGWGAGELDEGGQKVQIFNGEVSKYWGYNVQHDDYN